MTRSVTEVSAWPSRQLPSVADAGEEAESPRLKRSRPPSAAVLMDMVQLVAVRTPLWLYTAPPWPFPALPPPPRMLPLPPAPPRAELAAKVQLTMLREPPSLSTAP